MVKILSTDFKNHFISSRVNKTLQTGSTGTAVHVVFRRKISISKIM